MSDRDHPSGFSRYKGHAFPTVNEGEGITRAKAGKATKIYSLRIKQNDATSPMFNRLPAENKKLALQYAKNRWPNATIEVL